MNHPSNTPSLPNAGKVAVFALTLLFVASAFGQQGASTDFYRRFINESVIVNNTTGGSPVPIILRRIDANDITYSPQSAPSMEVKMPLANPRLRLQFPFPRAYGDALQAMTNEDYAAAVELMRPFAYPLTRFLVVDPKRFNGHVVVEKFYEAMVLADLFEEAIVLTRNLDLKNLAPRFTEIAIMLADRLVGVERNNEAIIVINLIPMEASRPEILPMIMDFAGKLRKGGKVNEALEMYRRIREVPGTPYVRSGTLWAAYCNILEGRATATRIFLDLVGPVEREEDDYSLLRLIEGRLLMDQSKYHEAMGKISEGLVYSDVSFEWMPDLMYAAGKNYIHLGEPNIASNIYYELTLFYPSDRWGVVAMEELKALPTRQELGESESSDPGLDTASRSVTGGEEWEDVEF